MGDDEKSDAGRGISSLADRLTAGLAEPWATLGLLLILIGAAILLYAVVRPLLLRWAKVIVKKTPVLWDDRLFGQGVFRWATHFVTARKLLFQPRRSVTAHRPGLEGVQGEEGEISAFIGAGVADGRWMA